MAKGSGIGWAVGFGVAVLAIGGAAAAAARGPALGGASPPGEVPTPPAPGDAGGTDTGDASWQDSEIPGLSVFTLDGVCAQARVDNLAALSIWVASNQSILAALDQQAIANGDPAGAIAAFQEMMGCAFNPAMVMHGQDGETFTMQQVIDMFTTGGDTAAALAPGATFLGLIGIRL